MRTAYLYIAAIAATSAVAITASAQARPLVRVSHAAACCVDPFIGTLVAETADSVWVRPERASSSSAPFALSRRSVHTIERGERVGAHKVVGAGLGLVAGALIGGAIGSASDCHCNDMSGMAAPFGALTGGMVGILTGTLIGAVIPHYEWEGRETSRRVAVTPLARGGIATAMSLSY